MKHCKLFLFSLIVLSGFFSSCSDEFIEGTLFPTTSPYYLNATELKLLFDANEGTRSFGVQSIGTTWMLSANAPWVTISPSSGYESTTVTVSVTKNEDYGVSRSCDIILTSSESGKEITRYVGVTQSSPDLLLNVSPDKITLKGGVGTATISVQCNSDWTYSCAEEWLAIEKTSTRLNLKASENATGASRSANIRLMSNGLEKSVIVTQNAAGVTVSSQTIQFGPTNSVKEIKITSEASWKVKTNDQWISVSPENGNSGEATIKVSVTANPSQDSRTGYFSITDQEIKVTQDGVKLSATSNLAFVESGESLNLNIESNVKWKLTKTENVSWITLSKTSGEGNATVSVTAKKNSETVRKTELILQTTDGAFSRTISITQSGSSATIIDDMQDFPAEGKLNSHNLPKNNESWTARVIEGSSWIKLSSTSGDVGFIIFTVEKNTSVAKRSGTIEIKYEDGATYRYIINQSGIGVILSAKLLQFFANGGTSYEITANTENVTIDTSASWITAKMVGKILSITAGKNTTSEQRSGIITVSFEDSKAMVTIYQMGLNSTFPSLVSIENNGAEFDMVRVNSATFSMGATEESIYAFENEIPAHNVTLSDYYIATTEVTQKLWKSVMKGYPSINGLVTTQQYEDNVPACYVNFNDCLNFIDKLKSQTGYPFRLPTEAEWEYAARGGKDNVYSGSSNASAVAWYSANATSPTAVAKKSGNAFGLYDMSGNVWEWCSDWYSKTYYKDSEGANNPQGPATGKYKVVRGGGWHGGEQYCRVTNRDYSVVDSRTNMLGMRLVMGGPIIEKEKKLSWAKGFNQNSYVYITPSELTKLLGITKAQINEAFSNGNAKIVTSCFDLKSGDNTATAKFGGWYGMDNQPALFDEPGGTNTVYIEVNDDIYHWSCGLQQKGCKIGDEHVVYAQYQICIDGMWHYVIVKIIFTIVE